MKQRHNRAITIGDRNDLGPRSKITRNGNHLFFQFGKFKGQPVKKANDGYLRWVLKNVELSSKEIKSLKGVLTGRASTKPTKK